MRGKLSILLIGLSAIFLWGKAASAPNDPLAPFQKNNELRGGNEHLLKRWEKKPAPGITTSTDPVGDEDNFAVWPAADILPTADTETGISPVAGSTNYFFTPSKSDKPKDAL